MQVGDALVRVDHRERGPVLVRRFDVGRDLGAFVCREAFDPRDDLAEAVVRVGPELLECRTMLLEDVRKEDANGVPKDDRVTDLHHGRLHVKRKENAKRFCVTHLLAEEGEERLLAHVGAVEDLAFEQGEAVLERGGRSVLGDMLDAHGGGGRQGDRLFVMEKVPCAHRRHVRLRLSRPGAHWVRVRARVLLHRVRRATVRVALAKNRVDRAPLDLAVALGDGALLVRLRILRVVGHRKALRLQLGDGCLHLRHRRADIRQLDDVRFWRLRETSKLCQRVVDSLRLGECFGEVRQDPTGERDVGELHGDVRRRSKRPKDGQQRIGRQQGCFVGLRVEDGRLLGHLMVLSVQKM